MGSFIAFYKEQFQNKTEKLNSILEFLCAASIIAYGLIGAALSSLPDSSKVAQWQTSLLLALGLVSFLFLVFRADYTSVSYKAIDIIIAFILSAIFIILGAWSFNCTFGIIAIFITIAVAIIISFCLYTKNDPSKEYQGHILTFCMTAYNDLIIPALQTVCALYLIAIIIRIFGSDANNIVKIPEETKTYNQIIGEAAVGSASATLVYSGIVLLFSLALFLLITFLKPKNNEH